MRSAEHPEASERHTISKFRVGAYAAMAFVTLMCAALVGTVGTSSASSAPVEGNGPNGNFWTVPAAPAGSTHGQLLYYNLSFVTQLDGATTWTVAYVSSDASGNPIVVTGTVAVPTAKWTGPGARPIVDFAVGTQGLGVICAPSRAFADGLEYEDPNINAALGKGYAVIISDYQWGGTNNTPVTTYMVGLSEGHTVLDIAKAALQLPPAGLTSASPVIVWGYSQGGGAAVEAGELQPTYAPSVHLIGVAAGGVPGNLPAVGAALDGGEGAGFLFMTIVGFHSAYPSLPYASLMNSAGTTMVANISTQCEGDDLLLYSGQHLSQYTLGGLTEAQVVQDGNWIPDLTLNSPGMPGAHVSVPMFNYAGTEDEIIPPAVENATYANLCATGTVVQSSTLATDHIFGDFEFQGQVLTFIANRVNGATPTNSCLTNSSTL